MAHSAAYRLTFTELWSVEIIRLNEAHDGPFCDESEVRRSRSRTSEYVGRDGWYDEMMCDSRARLVILISHGRCASAEAFVVSFALGMLGVECPGNSGWGRDGAGGAGIRRAAGKYYSRLVCAARGPDVGAIDLVGGGGASCLGGAGSWADLGRPLALAGTKTFARG